MSKKIWTSVGTDPEYMLMNKYTGDFKSSLDIIPGTKQAPYNLDELGEGFSLQKDNVLLEFCVPPVFNDNGITADDFIEMHNNVYRAIEYTKEAFLEDTPYNIVAQSVAKYKPEELDNEYARTFGCSASINAWTTDTFVVENDPNNLYRGAGYHIHIGYTNQDIESTLQLVKLLDIFVAVPNLRNNSEAVENAIRRKQYGRAGDFRITPWGGFEYRVLGSGAITGVYDAVEIYRGIEKAFKYLNNGFEISERLAFDTQICINTCNVGMVDKILEGLN